MRRPTALLLCALPLSACAGPEPDPVALTDPAWELQYEDSTSFLIAIHAVDERTVWAAGWPGRVVKTTDGGASWSVMSVPGADSLEFRDVQAFDDTTAYVLSIGNGADSRVYKTTDGGGTWDLSFQNEDDNAFFDCFSFWDTSSGFAFSDSHEGEFTLISTDDGGGSWSRIDPSIVPDAREGEGAFATGGTCVQTWEGGLGWFVTGASAVDTRVIRTTDYGASWSESVTPIPSRSASEGIATMSVLDADHVAVLGGDPAQPDSAHATVAISTDGGATWIRRPSTPMSESVFGSTYVPGMASPTIIAVSRTGTAFTTDNAATWSEIDDSDFWSVTAVSATGIWAVGGGRVARLVDDGN